jgi:error-prone DNA polymerase
VFCAALLNSQPMGFYAPAQVVRDAREHGVEVRPVCVNASRWDCTLEPAEGGRLALRLGLRMVAGLGNAEGARLAARRGALPYAGIGELRDRAELPRAALERLAEADAFYALGLDRRAALWAVRGLEDGALPLFAAAGQGAAKVVEPTVALVPMTEGREVVEDYRATGLSLRRHPVAFLRGDLASRGMIRCADLATARDGRRVVVPGLVLVRQRPGSAKGVTFLTIEDETGVANVVIWPDLFERQHRLLLSAGMVACHGRVQREGEVVHVIAQRLEDLTALLEGVAGREGAFPLRHGRGDEAKRVVGADPRDGAALRVPTRDFR